VELLHLRGRGEGEYVLGVVVEGALADLPEADAAALGAAFGGAQGPKVAAAAGFRARDGLDLLVRVLY
jgi:hypothetical protein